MSLDANLQLGFQQVATAMKLRILASEKGANNGVATLGSDGKVPSGQLPSYVDDVVEYTNLAGFPTTGETGKIYVALDTNVVYRWSGTVYVKITSGEVSSVAGRTGAVTLTKSDVGLANVDNTTDANKPVSSAQAIAIALKANIASPTFTGTVSGITATMVGLGNVTNESKATMFTSPTFTGTVAGISKAMVGLGNVDNTSDAAKPISTATQTAITTLTNNVGATNTDYVAVFNAALV